MLMDTHGLKCSLFPYDCKKKLKKNQKIFGGCYFRWYIEPFLKSPSKTCFLRL